MRALALLAGCLLAGLAGTAQGEDDAAINARAIERVPALVDVAAQACAAASQHPTLSSHALQSAIRDARTQVDEAAASRGTFDQQARAQIAAILDALQARIGPLDTTASLALQLDQATLARLAGDIDRVVDRRAFNYALLLHIHHSGDGSSPEQAFRACLPANAYEFLQLAMSVRTVERQRLVQASGRWVDALDVVMPDGSPRTFYFDVTDAFNSHVRLQGQ